MKIFDRYIIKQFLLTALFALIAFTVIFVVVDMMENLDDFIDKRVDTAVVVQYYLYFMPEIIKLMIPVGMLLSSLFTTGRLSNQNELTAIKASGVSLYQFMLPLLIVGFIISILSVYFNGWIVPEANKKKFYVARVHLQRYLEAQGKYNIFMQDTATRIIAIGYFDDVHNVAHRVSIQDFSDTNPTVMVARFDANQMAWDSTTGTWKILNGMKRFFIDEKEYITHVAELNIGKLHFAPDDIVKKVRKPDELDYFELRAFIENQRRSGNDVSRWLVDFYGKISFPFANFIVVLFGVPFSSTKRRSGLAVEFGISIGICFTYLLFMKISQVFGYTGVLNPLFTAWLANLIFLVAGIANLLRVRK